MFYNSLSLTYCEVIPLKGYFWLHSSSSSSMKAVFRHYYSTFQISTYKLMNSLKKLVFLNFFHDFWDMFVCSFCYTYFPLSIYDHSPFHPLSVLKTGIFSAWDHKFAMSWGLTISTLKKKKNWSYTLDSAILVPNANAVLISYLRNTLKVSYFIYLQGGIFCKWENPKNLVGVFI